MWAKLADFWWASFQGFIILCEELEEMSFLQGYYLLPTTYPFNKIFQHHALPPAAAAAATISSSSVITSNINSNKIYVIDSKGSANNVSATVLTYDYDTVQYSTRKEYCEM